MGTIRRFVGLFSALVLLGAGLGLASVRAAPTLGESVIYVSSTGSVDVDGISARDEDILVWDGATDVWSLYVDGSDVGLGGVDVGGFHIVDDGDPATLDPVLVSIQRNAVLDGIAVDDSDILRLDLTSTGDTTAGTWSVFLDGDAVGLSTSGEDIRSIGFTADGRLVVSTRGTYSVPGDGGGTLSGPGGDLIVREASGDWSRFIDGSDIGLSSSGERIRGASIDPVSGAVFGTTAGSFSTSSLSGTKDQIWVFPGTTGEATSGSLSLFWDGADHRVAGENLDAVHVAATTPAPFAPAQLGGPSTDDGFGVAVDVAGNVYTTGRFQGTTDFDPDPITTLNLTSAGVTDAFVSKLDSSGDLVWVRQLGGPSIDEGVGVAVDAAGNVYTAGTFHGTADFDPGPGVFNLTSAGFLDVFVWKLDSAGDLVWARQLGGTGILQGFGVAVDGAGSVYTTGTFEEGTADFDPGPGVFNLTPTGDIDGFVSKLDSAGDFVWARQAGTSILQGFGVAVDGVGNVYTTGDFEGTADFDPGPGVFNLTPTRVTDAFVWKLDSAGNLVWARQHGSGALAIGVAVDADGNVYTTGFFSGTADFDPHPVTTLNLTSAGGNDVFVSKLDSSGDLVWARHLGGTSTDRGFGVAVDAAGNVHTTGSFQDTADFDPDPITTLNLTSAGNSDAFVWKLDSNGDFVWARQLAGPGFDEGRGVAVDAAGNVHTTGSFQETADFDPDPITTLNLTSAGDRDVFVWQLNSSGNLP